MPPSTISHIVRKYFADYITRDRKAVQDILAANFRFYSPYDPGINAAAYFERCWPPGDAFLVINIEKLFAQGDEAFVRYQIETKSGERFRNTEFITLKEGKIARIDVYFGSLPKALD